MPRKILVIDDEEWLIQPVLDRLEYEEVDYVYAQTGFEGLEYVRNSADQYAAIILDMKIPLGDFSDDFDPDLRRRYPIPGIYVLEEIRKLDPDIPILCFTVLEDHFIRQHTQKWKAMYYKKGKDEQVLFEDIRRHLQDK